MFLCGKAELKRWRAIDASLTVTFINCTKFLLTIMKLPKLKKRYCPYCRKHTEHSVKQQSFRGLNKTHTQSKGSKSRVRARGLRRGVGNLGRFSRPAIAKWKMTGSKTSKKSDLRYTCKECKKTHVQKKGIRAKKLEFS